MVVSFEIHPAIGIARVGNSDKHFVFSGRPASLNSLRRDSNGLLLRQAAEFRVYEIHRDTHGRIIKADEVSNANATIEWSAHVANRKAVAQKLLKSGKLSVVRRNKSTGKDRNLIVNAGKQTVVNAGERKRLVGKFKLPSMRKGQEVELGEIRVAAKGRLLFIGGDGSAASPTGKQIGHFANNNEWFDTISDGVIRARIRRAGKPAVDALPSRIIVAPPDYAPGITNLVTLYDVLVDLAIKRGVLKAPQKISFSRHVRPILERAVGYQWVNRATRKGFNPSGGHSSGGGKGDFSQIMERLGNRAPPHDEREAIFRHLRDPSRRSKARGLQRMPRINDDKKGGDVFALTTTQYDAMRCWAKGDFVRRLPSERESEPERLTRMALESCSGGPFFPGMEASCIVREPEHYMRDEAFRLSPKVKPGQLTQENAVPWQADFQECKWDKVKRLGWWPAQRPDDVLSAVGADPVPWTRGIDDSVEGMLENWHRLGFVKESPAHPGMYIEMERDLPP